MAINPHYSALELLPRNHEQLTEETLFEISDHDQTVPGNFITPCLIFPIADDADNNKIIESLQIGLENVLMCIPLVAGKLHNNPVTNKVEVIRRNHEPITFGVHRLDQQGDVFPTYEELTASGFPPDFFHSKTAYLTPPGSNLSVFRRDDGCPVALFQANFISGGLILTLSLHHMCGDAKSIDHVFSLWASSTKAAMNGQQMPPFEPVLDRTYFNVHSTPDAERTEALKKDIKGFIFLDDDSDNQVTNEPPARPETSMQLYHFSDKSCRRLKSICAPKNPGEYVSTYDCIAAATWRAITRARLPYLGLQDIVETRYNHPVDTRPRFPSSVDDRYFGNGFILTATEPIRMNKLLSSDGLTTAALAVRKSILDVNETTMATLTDVQHAVAGKQKMLWEWRRQDPLGTSWTSMRVFDAYDFGMGFPKALRIPVVPYEPVFGVLPAADKDGKRDGLDVYVVIEKGSSERMMLDEEYSAYRNL